MKSISFFHNKILEGDCVELLKTLPANSVDLVFADPPYNLQLKQELYRPNQTKVNGVKDAWDQFSSFKEYDTFTEAWLKQCQRILKPTGSLWLIGSYHNIFRLGYSLQNLGFWILNDIIWIKSNPMPNFKGTRFTNAHETLIWASKNEKSKYTFNYKTMKLQNEDKQMRSDWLFPICSGKERLKNQEGKKLHSTQKPESLLTRILLASTKQKDLVLDPFFGSGTTGAVAKKLNRKFIGIEREKKYIQIAKQRIKQVQAYSSKLLSQQIDQPKPKVPFVSLIENRLIEVGEKLYSKNKKHWAIVMADGSLKNGKYFGSIHSTSAQMQNKPSYNGWLFWNIERKSKLISINQLREKHFS